MGSSSEGVGAVGSYQIKAVSLATVTRDSFREFVYPHTYVHSCISYIPWPMDFLEHIQPVHGL